MPRADGAGSRAPGVSSPGLRITADLGHARADFAHDDRHVVGPGAPGERARGLTEMLDDLDPRTVSEFHVRVQALASAVVTEASELLKIIDIGNNHDA